MAAENAGIELPRRNRELLLCIANIPSSNENLTSFRIRRASSTKFSKQSSLGLKRKPPQYSNESEKERIMSPSCGISVQAISSFSFT